MNEEIEQQVGLCGLHHCKNSVQSVSWPGVVKDPWPGNGPGPILTATEPTWGMSKNNQQVCYALYQIHTHSKNIHTSSEKLNSQVFTMHSFTLRTNPVNYCCPKVIQLNVLVTSK